MLARVRDTIARFRMCKSGERIGVACSGGPDSVALLEALLELAPSLGVSLGVVHLNHHLRGEESAADEAFVRQLASARDLEAYVESADIAAAARDSRRNLEETGREARYAWFGELIRRGVFDRVATGHTRSDQAETVLFRLLRGSSPDGLSSIRPVRAPGVIRPLLGVERSDVEAFLAARGAEHRLDQSNHDLRFARNRIRQDLLPQLARDWNPRAAQALARLGEQAAEDAAYWEARVDRWQSRLLHPSAEGLVFRADELSALDPALRRRLLRRALELVGGAGRFDFQHVEALRALVEQRDSGAGVSLPGVTAQRSCGKIRLMPLGPASSAEPLPLEPPAEFAAPDGRTRVRIELQPRDAAPGSYTKPNWDGIDWNRVPKPLVFRSWRPGDRLGLNSGSEPKKLSALLQSSEIPSWDRARWPVLASVGNGGASDDRIVWARGFGVSSDFRPFGNIGQVLSVFEFDEAGRAWTGPRGWETISAGLSGSLEPKQGRT